MKFILNESTEQEEIKQAKEIAIGRRKRTLITKKQSSNSPGKCLPIVLLFIFRKMFKLNCLSITLYKKWSWNSEAAVFICSEISYTGRFKKK